MGGHGTRRTAVLLLAVLVLGVVLAAPAAADGGAGAGDLRVAQSLGDRQLTVVLRRAGPGPLRVDVVVHAGPAGELALSTRSDGVVADRAVVTLPERPGTVGVTLRVDHTGPWELGLADGERTALIPFVITDPATSPVQRTAYGGWIATGAALLVTLVVAVRARRWWTPLVPAAGVVVAATVAVTAALLSATVPPPVEPGRFTDPTRETRADRATAPGDATSRPPVNVLVSAPDAVAGRPVDVVLDITDAATGRPADDLLVHHDALVHLVVVGPSGRVWHLHPVRTDRGRYTARLTPEPGRHAVTAEVARRGGGVQQVRSTLDVPGDVGASGPAHVPAPAATVSVEPAPAGTPTVLVATFGDAPTLHPWLGMAGHLLVAGPLPAGTEVDGPAGVGPGGAGTGVDQGRVGAAVAAAPVWAHVHAATPTDTPGLPAPDVTVAAFGPQVRFAFTFPRPGRYRLWFQAMREHTVLTMPATIDVPAAVDVPAAR